MLNIRYLYQDLRNPSLQLKDTTQNQIKNIKINVESLPQRCEICHQIDCFDPKANQCSRCEKMIEAFSLVKRKRFSLDYKGLSLIYGAICGAVLGQEVRSYVVGNHSYTIEVSCWAIIGLAVLGTFWGVMGQRVRQPRKNSSD